MLAVEILTLKISYFWVYKNKTLVKKYLKAALKIILSVAALYIIINKVDLDKAWSYLKEARWYFIVLAWLSFMVSKSIGAYRINIFYKTKEILIPHLINLKVYFLGMFYNLFIPLVGGEGYKVIYLRSRFKAPAKSLVGAAFLDRLSGVVALSMLAIVFFNISSFEIPYKSYSWLLIPLVYFGYWLFIKLFFKSYIKAFWSTNLHSIGVQALQVACTFFVIKAIGIDSLVSEYLFVFLLASFAFVLPMMGAREMAFVFGSDYLGLDQELSLAISLLFYLSMAASSLVGAYFLIFPKSLGKSDVDPLTIKA